MKEKKAILEKLSKILKKNKKETKASTEIIENLKQQIEKLENIDDKEITSTIELIETGRTFFKAFQWQERLVAQYHFFGTTLGYLDGVLDELRRDKRLLSFFDGEEQAIKTLEEKQIKFLEKRQEIVADYKETTSKNEPPLIMETLQTYPSYQQFTKLYTDLEENHYQLNLQNELIIAYNNGYIASTKIEPETFLETYHGLYQELCTYKQNNQKKKEQVEEKVKLKK